MTEHRTTAQIRRSETPIFFEDNQPSSMEWVRNIGAVCTFDVNLNEKLMVNGDMIQEIADHTPLAGKTLLMCETDPYDVRDFGVPRYLASDIDEMDTDELAERCPELA